MAAATATGVPKPAQPVLVLLLELEQLRGRLEEVRTRTDTSGNARLHPGVAQGSQHAFTLGLMVGGELCVELRRQLL